MAAIYFPKKAFEEPFEEQDKQMLHGWQSRSRQHSFLLRRLNTSHWTKHVTYIPHENPKTATDNLVRARHCLFT
jgi:hypothetical protein